MTLHNKFDRPVDDWADYFFNFISQKSGVNITDPKKSPEYTAIADKINNWQKTRRPFPKKNWDIIFLKQAYEWSEYSHDARTKHGCVLTNRRHRVIAAGYNGFIRGIDDSVLPNYDGAKYPFMLHSEMSCLLDCANQGKSTYNTIMYITGEPCLNCLQAMYQAGVKEIVYGNRQSVMLNSDIDYITNKAIILGLIGDKMAIRHIDYGS
jgi:dCMP deaminase